jgi:hypothetical protein
MIALGATARTTGGEIFSFIAAGVLAAMAARGVTLGVRVGATGIVTRGMLRTRRVLWSELEKFSFGATSLFPAVGIARFVDGRQFAITAISTGARRATASSRESRGNHCRTKSAPSRTRVSISRTTHCSGVFAA